MSLVLFAFLALVLDLVRAQAVSPCPDVFVYEPRTSEDNIWYGVISLKTEQDLNGVWVRVILDREAESLGNWFGTSTTDDRRDFLIKNRNYKLAAGPPITLRFFIKYPSSSSVPKLESIRLNGKVICPVQAPASETSGISQLHISELRPSENNQRPQTTRPTYVQTEGYDNIGNYNSVGREPPTDNLASNLGSSTGGFGGGFQGHSGNDNDFFPGDFARPTNRPVVRPKPVSTGKKYACGTVSTRPTPLITYGQNASDGQWPWHAALYHSQGVQLTYICGGSLVSEYFIVTAAHCVARQSTNQPINPQNLLVYLGKSNLKKFGAETQTMEISKIIIHREYNSTVFHNDIALLKISRAAEYTDFVRPICLWSGSTELSGIIDKLGTVVGWGFDEYGQLTNTLTQAKMPVVASTTCIYSNPDFFSRFTFDKSFCAGFRNGTSVCNGDSGGGMVFPKRSSDEQEYVWQIRGLVSVGVALQGSKSCDTKHYVVFTDVAKHVDWIRMVLSSS